MSLYELEWELKATRRKWFVKRKFGTAHVAVGDEMSFEPGGVKKGVSPWSKAGTYSYNSTLEQAEGEFDPGSGVIDFTIHHANCLICTVETGTAWVAIQKVATDAYRRNWGNDKTWTVVASNTTNVPASDTTRTTTVIFDGADIKIAITGRPTTVWGVKSSYDAVSETINGTLAGVSPPKIEIIRRVGMFCQFPGSGGNSWIAVEGG